MKTRHEQCKELSLKLGIKAWGCSDCDSCVNGTKLIDKMDKLKEVYGDQQ